MGAGSAVSGGGPARPTAEARLTGAGPMDTDGGAEKRCVDPAERLPTGS